MKFRTTNHHFPVEIGRWFNIPYNERLFELYNEAKIGDEYHSFI
jgi:hypothetical protein